MVKSLKKVYSNNTIVNSYSIQFLILNIVLFFFFVLILNSKIILYWIKLFFRIESELKNEETKWQPRLVNTKYFKSLDFTKETVIFVIISTAGDGKCLNRILIVHSWVSETFHKAIFWYKFYLFKNFHKISVICITTMCCYKLFWV